MGITIAFTTLGTSKPTDLATLLGYRDPTPSYAITVRADPNNASSLYASAGQSVPVMPFYANDSATFMGARPEEILFNDQGNNGLIFYFTFSGAIPKEAFHVTAHIAQDGPGQ
jgi:hypothetical protein